MKKVHFKQLAHKPRASLDLERSACVCVFFFLQQQKLRCVFNEFTVLQSRHMGRAPALKQTTDEKDYPPFFFRRDEPSYRVGIFIFPRRLRLGVCVPW